ncbi:MULTISPECIES: hypothetical protein [unclassified Caballeronia]|uniref:hypothetical protein n=1 Tax=unclassified Caballeronia TaxID=2646786 RepID=UPI002028B90E|nr:MULTISPECIES: hypothetical protein [unclassified Caballeronia]MDR5770840.1 hypothetical protein [Caballeronia sp. LZ002]MDR5846277.1 hypothetical protein [Caballeronia sp. LZ003]
MDQAKLRETRRVGLAAALAVMSAYAVSAPVYTMPGGTITFRGALVAPPFGVSTSTAATSATFSATNHASDQTVSVHFTPPPTDAPNARVAIAGSVYARFADGAGRQTARGSDGTFHVGATGGVLSMSAPSTALVTVVTDYQ